MKYDLGYERDIVGNKINVKLIAEGDEKIASVHIILDNFDLSRDELDPPVQQYEKSLNQQGQAGPGMKHELKVNATGAGGEEWNSVKKWTDER